MTNTERVCKIARQRSTEHKEAISLVCSRGLYGQAISILRQELDSMVRALYLLQITNLAEREHLVTQLLNGQRWRKLGTNAQITDKNMVEIADSLHGWAKSVYKFGCAFVHLSTYHEYSDNDPFDSLAPNEIQDIKSHLNYYHGFSMSSELKIQTISRYIPMIFDKIAGNLECYLSDLEEGTIRTH
jgi:hypothetical protein